MTTNTDRPNLWVYGEKKHSKTFMLTNTASKLIGETASELGITRSEVIERAIRNNGLLAAGTYTQEKDQAIKVK